MIVNRGQEAVEERLRAEAGSNEVVRAVAEAIEAATDPFEIEIGGAGLEFAARGMLPNQLPNRARMKIFSPKPGSTLVFFFKRSMVPYSRDRYSYGGLELRAPQVESKEIGAWLEFLSSGFHPDKRPENLRRAFPYEIPE